MGVYSTTVADAYADKIKAVYEYLDEIRKVADRLTPVEDLTSFQAQIAELYARLDLLVEASTLIVTATPTGEAILTGSVPSIQTLLGIPAYTEDHITQAELDAALAALQTGTGNSLAVLTNGISAINIQLGTLEQFGIQQQAAISGLQISYDNVAAGLETNQLNTTSALSRLTVQEQYATLVDQRLNSIDQNLISANLGIQASNSIIAGHTASIQSTQNSISLNTASIDQLSSTYTDLEAGVTANTTALTLMQTSIEGLGDDIVAQSQQTVALKSVIGGSGNLLPNADFAVGANGWAIVVAEEDWASTILTTNTFNMPVDVNCLEVLGTPSPLGQIVVESSPILLEGGEHYIVSGYPCVDNGTITLSYKAFNQVGAVVGQGVCPATFNVTTDLNFNNYTRTHIKFLAAATAVKLRLYLTVTGDGDFITQGALFRPMVEKSWIDQIGPGAWTPNTTGVNEALATAVNTLSTQVQLIDGELSAISTDNTSLLARIGTIESSLISEMITSANKNSTTAISINLLNSRMTDAETDLTGQATILDSLTTSVSNINGTLAVQAGQITNVQAGITTAQGDVVALTGAMSLLDARVVQNANGIIANATSINGVSAQLGNKANVSVTESLQAQINTTNGGLASYYASWTINLDVNGYISGIKSTNTGAFSTFEINADSFRIVKPGGGKSLTWENGTLWNKGLTHSVLIGQDMSPTADVIFWVGPNPVSAATASKEDASVYITEDGAAMFRGLVNQSLLTGSAMELGSTRIHTGGGRLAPFSIKDVGYRGQADGSTSMTITLNGFVSPDVGTGYDHKRFSRLKADVVLTATLHGDYGPESLFLEVQYDGGSWSVIDSFSNIDVDWRGGFTMLFRYTTAAVWNSVAFRARTSNNNTQALAFTVDIDNTKESGNTAGSNSGPDASNGGGGAAPPPSGGGGGSGGGDSGGEFCVEYNTVLPDGRLVRELSVGDQVECVNMLTGERGLFPLLGIGFGEEECYRVVTQSGEVIQSKSTPMDMADGSVVRTPDLAGCDLLHYSGRFEVASIEFVGMRRVCKPDFGNRMFFAGVRVNSTLATHNIAFKVDP